MMSLCSSIKEWYDDFTSYFHVVAIIIILTVIYFMLTYNWGLSDTHLVQVRSTINVFHQGSQHNLASIVNNFDLLENRIIRVQLGRHAEEFLFTTTEYENIVPVQEDLEDNRSIFGMTLSTSVFWATPIFNQDGFLLGIYFEEVGYGMFLERWLESREAIPCGYADFCG